MKIDFKLVYEWMKVKCMNYGGIGHTKCSWREKKDAHKNQGVQPFTKAYCKWVEKVIVLIVERQERLII